MGTREVIRAAAARQGWELVTLTDESSYDEFFRKATVKPGGRLAKIAEISGYDPREAVWVRYSDSGGITDAVRRTPGDQAVLDGHFVGFSDEAKGKDKRGQVLAWLAIQLQY